MASDMKVRMKQRCVIEFLHAEKIAPSDIHKRLLKVYGEQTVDVNTVKQWIMCFSSGDNSECDKSCSVQPSKSENSQKEEQLKNS